VHLVTTDALSPTMIKFGAPGSIVRDYVHWSVLLRPKQVTLGSLVLIAKETATAWPMLSAGAFEELKAITADIEQALRQCFDHDKINYLMLMMVDPDVHFHVIPRYCNARTFGGVEFSDSGWPGPPRLEVAAETGEIVNNSLSDQLIRSWPN
jgi:diadenosine tetraphosphate (Ap4A) HIT family hydrolase